MNTFTLLQTYVTLLGSCVTILETYVTLFELILHYLKGMRVQF